MRNIVWILFVAVLVSCQDVTIGFLNVEKAGYEIDSLEVKAVLDNAVPEIIPNPEYERYVDMGFDPERCIEMGIYPTLEIGGGEDYTRDKYNIPWTSTPIEGVDGTAPIYDIPVGRYVISLTFSNEGYSKDVDNCFTIIVK